jgi:hypothetical protein
VRATSRHGAAPAKSLCHSRERRTTSVHNRRGRDPLAPPWIWWRADHTISPSFQPVACLPTRRMRRLEGTHCCRRLPACLVLAAARGPTAGGTARVR